MAVQFERITNPLAKTTKSFHTFEYEKALYGAIFVKPNKRLRKIFASDKEVLVLITNFTDQQQRTISALKAQIAESGSRLESALAIVVHVDNDGNIKLKNWGREQGLSLLPVLHQAHADVNAFERDILQDFFANDPFDVTGPVSDDARFFGRRTEALDIVRQLKHGQIVSCLGIRKIGKTSILNRVLQEARSDESCVCAIVDCSKDEIWEQSAARLLGSIAEAVGLAAAARPRYAEVGRTIDDRTQVSQARTKLLEAIKRCGCTVIVFFDEVDYITPGSPVARNHWINQFNPFWRNLRAVVQEATRIEHKLSLFVCGVSSKWFKEESINGVENAALAFIPEGYLSPLASAASAGMITTIAKTAGLLFDGETAEWIGNACGNMPYWTRKACSYVHRHVDLRTRPYPVPRETAQRLVGEFIEVEGAAVAEVALNHLFRVHPDVYPSAVSVLDGGDHNRLEPFISTLLRYGVLVEEGGRVHFGSAMIAEGMKRYVASRTSSSEIINGQPESFSRALKLGIDEWADELALINASRNKLEKRIRLLALNFLRLAALQKKDSQSLSERFLKAIDERRRAALRNLPVDDLVEKMLWTELIVLIGKEWDVFQLVFHDRALLNSHAAVINDRPDAHAKDIDAADLALYRKSLRWLEEAIQRIS